MSLEWGFFKETQFPVLERRATSIEDTIISLLPYQPGSQDEDFHKESCGALLSIIHHWVEVQIEVSIDAKVIPTLQAKGVGEE